MKPQNNRYRIALVIALGAASTLAMASSPVTTSEAQAFGLSDITGAAKKVGGAVKKGAKKAGGAAKKAAKVAVPIAKIVAMPQRQATNIGLKAISEGILKPHAELTRQAAKLMGKEKEFGQAGEDELKGLYDKWLDVDQLVSSGARAAKKAGKTVGKVITGRHQIGESLPRPDNSKAINALLDYANGNLQTTRRGRARANQKGVILKPGIVGNGAFLGKRSQSALGKDAPRKGVKLPKGQQMKITLPKGQLGNDKSVWGRPVGGIKAPNKGIARKDIQRRKSHRFPKNQKLRITLPKGQLGNDKSIWGRPVGGIKAPNKGISRKNVERRKSHRVSKNRKLRITLPKEQAKKGGAFLGLSNGKKKVKQRSRNNQRLNKARRDDRRSSLKRRASTKRARVGKKMLRVNKSRVDRRASKRGRRR